jgi:hypothetical protein
MILVHRRWEQATMANATKTHPLPRKNAAPLPNRYTIM